MTSPYDHPQKHNFDPDVADGFGREWTTFRQRDSELSATQREVIHRAYFGIFPWEQLPSGGGTGMDVGCGSGRWAKMVAPRVAHLHLIDVSSAALAVARENLAGAENVSFINASVGEIPLPDASQDFAYALGVLHHVPDTEQAIAEIAKKLKPGAPFLIYLYYAFDNRPTWFRRMWLVANVFRLGIVRMPPPGRFLVSQMIAGCVYWPLARLARILERMGLMPSSMPLSWYRNMSFYVMRTDAYDRFCTKIEKRFSKSQIEAMLLRANFRDVRFSNVEPYWCAIATRC